MLLSLAWKNIWRNKKRSMVIILATTSGLWGGLFLNAVWVGMIDSMVETTISRNLAHVQIHKPGYDEEQQIREFIPDGESVINSIKRDTLVNSFSARTLSMGMAASPSSSYGVQIIGINPEHEAEVCDIAEHIREGNFLDSKYRNPIVVGAKLADRLNLNMRSKVVLSFQNLQGDISYIACRVVGIFKTNSTQFDEMHVYVKQTDLIRSLESEPIFHEIAIRTEHAELVSSLKEGLVAKFPELTIETWKEIAPELAYLSDMMSIYAYLFVGIIVFALLFGITNTMLMSVVERFKELGMLLAIGMNKKRVFIMILSETILLSITGGICGMIIAALTIALTGWTGIDLSFIATSLESFGSATMLYPNLPLSMYFGLTIMIIFTAIGAAIMPAYKAMKLTPAEAIRTN